MGLTAIICVSETFRELILQNLESRAALLPLSVVSYHLYYPYLYFLVLTEAAEKPSYIYS